jgi:hypothetical protein
LRLKELWPALATAPTKEDREEEREADRGRAPPGRYGEERLRAEGEERSEGRAGDRPKAFGA